MAKRIIENGSLFIKDDNGTELFSMEETFSDDRMSFKVNGNISMNVAHDFEDELTAAASVCSHITVDFSGVDVVSSAGIKALLVVQRILDKRPDASLKLKGMNPSVYEMFDDMGFVELFDIEN